MKRLRRKLFPLLAMRRELGMRALHEQPDWPRTLPWRYALKHGPRAFLGVLAANLTR